MPTVDLSALLDDTPPDDPPRIAFGGVEHQLPARPPAALIAAFGSNSWAHQFGTDDDKKREGAKLAAAVVAAVGPVLAGAAPLGPLLKAVGAAYGLTGESSASSD